MRVLRSSLSFAALVAVAHAQQALVVPAAATSADAPSLRWIAGAEALRQQILIDAGHLTALQGRTLTALAVRRDTGRAHGALPSLAIRLKVRLSTSPRSAVSPASRLSSNAGSDEVTVFDGPLTLPAAPAVAPGASVPWNAAHTVRMAFATPFPYAGGTLCIDLDGAPIGTGAFWPVDAAHEALAGTWIRTGESCGSHGGPGVPTAAAAAATLVAGCGARFSVRGEPGAAAVLAVGLAAQPNVLPLAFLGAAPGCALHVAGLAGSANTVIGSAVGPRAWHGGIGAVELPIPAQGSLFGARFAVQWITIGTQIAASNALDCTIASGLPALGMALVTHRPGEPAGVGGVDTTAAPVVRIEAR